MSFIAERMHAIQPSASLQISAKAKALKEQGVDVIGLSAGEPDFDTPDHIKSAGIKAIESGDTKYTAVDGTSTLKQAIIHKLKRDNQLTYTPDQILVSSGAKQSIFNLFMATLNPGDEVIIPAPFWVSYPDMAKLCGAKPIIIEAKLEHDLKITAEQLQAAITPKTKILMFNTPSNPSGMVYSRAELEALGDVLRQHPHILIATDDIYEHILWSDEPFCNIAMACPDLTERTIVINGASKAYSMTGWRIGYAAGEKSIIASMKKLQSQSTSNPSSISQAAAAEALDAPQDCIKPMLAAFIERHDYLVKALNDIPGFACKKAQGAFYAFPYVQDAIDAMDGIDDDVAFSAYLLDTAKVAVVPGSAYGTPGFIRLSFATSMENLQKAIERIHAAVS